MEPSILCSLARLIQLAAIVTLLAPVGMLGADNPIKPDAKAEKTCQDYWRLLMPGHMKIGVKMNVVEISVEDAFSIALDYWSETLDMDWHVDSSADSCSLELVYDSDPDTPDTTLAWTFAPLSNVFDGVVRYNPRTDVASDRNKLITIFIHEIGHVLGLLHSDDPNSVMFADAGEQGKVLTEQDLRDVSVYHTLRRSLRQVRKYDPTER